MGVASVCPRHVSLPQTPACINGPRAGFALERFGARTPRVAFSGIITATAVLAMGGAASPGDSP